MTTAKKEDFNFNTAHQASYVNIVEPKAYEKAGQKKGDPKYSALFIIEPDNADLVRLKTEVAALLKSKANGKTVVARRLTQEEMDSGTHVEVNVPWKAGNVEADRLKAKGDGDDTNGALYRGKVLVKASSKYQPALSIIENGKIIDLVTDEAKAKAVKYFYSGAYLVPSFGLNWYKGDAGKPDGVSLYLNAVLFAKNGPRIGGQRRSASETFKNYIGSISNEDPTGATAALDDF